MDALRCPPPDTPVKVLSGGERRRVALTRLLLQEPDILLLDEPTNHLDAESVAWLERHLQEYKGTVIAVTHDRYFLDNVAGWILEFDRGEGIPWKGNYSSWLEQKQARLAVGGEDRIAAPAHPGPRARMGPHVAQGPPGQGQGPRHRLREAAQPGLRALSGRTGICRSRPVPRLGDVVIELEGVVKAYGDRVLIEGLTISLPPGSIVGVIGPNGAGKTTLLRMITGQEAPDAGRVLIGETVKLAYADQSRDPRPGEDRMGGDLRRQGHDQVGGREMNARAYCGLVQLLRHRPAEESGRALGRRAQPRPPGQGASEGGNVLLLDEPTNDLDVNTLRALEDALEDFAGCAVVVSHDRWFLDRVATHILAFEEDGSIHWIFGNFTEYHEDLKRRRGAAAGQPHRMKYRTLKR